MEKMDFYVYLSPKEAAEKVKEAVTAGLYSMNMCESCRMARKSSWFYSRNTICAPATEPR